jgi:hypothetical protein
VLTHARAGHGGVVATVSIPLARAP